MIWFHGHWGESETCVLMGRRLVLGRMVNIGMILDPVAIAVVITRSAALIYVMLLMLHPYLTHGRRVSRPGVCSSTQESFPT
jgi:hypothetical protein